MVAGLQPATGKGVRDSLGSQLLGEGGLAWVGTKRGPLRAWEWLAADQMASLLQALFPHLDNGSHRLWGGSLWWGPGHSLSTHRAHAQWLLCWCGMVALCRCAIHHVHQGTSPSHKAKAL